MFLNEIREIDLFHWFNAAIKYQKDVALNLIQISQAGLFGFSKIKTITRFAIIDNAMSKERRWSIGGYNKVLGMIFCLLKEL